MKLLSVIFLNIIITCTAFAQEKKDSNCPSPSEDDIVGLCNAIYNKKPCTKRMFFTYEFELTLWKLVCTEPTDEIIDNPEKLQQVHKRVQAMWLNNRNRFLCRGFPLREGNVTNFSINSGFTTFLRSAVKVYKLDMNFKVTEQGTVMDYLVEQIDSYKRADMSTKVSELEKIYKVLENAGTKHAKDL